MEENSVIYNAGDKVAIIVDEKIFRVGIISEFIGDNVVIETPTSIVRCNFKYIKHYND